MERTGAGRHPSRGGATDGDDDLDPTAVAALIAEQRARVQRATDVEQRVLFGAWGAAWLIGFGLQWAALRDLIPVSHGVTLLVFTLLLLGATAVTTIHLARRTSGIRGESAVQGAMYGWSWMLAFAGVGALSYALGRLGASPEVMVTVLTVVPAIVVGALYMAGGAIWSERQQFVLGAWICVVTVAAAVAGLPHMLLVMAVAGGGGMLVLAALDSARRARGDGDRSLGRP